MVQKVLTNAKVLIGASDVSDHVKSVNLEYTVDAVDATKMGDTTKNSKVGLRDIKCDLELHQDYADNSIDEIIFGFLESGAINAIAIRPDNAAISANNPEYQFSAFVSSHSPVAGSVGEGPMTKVTLTPSGGGALVRDITP